MNMQNPLFTLAYRHFPKQKKCKESSRKGLCGSDVKQKIHYITILNNVILAFYTHFSFFLCPCLSPAGNKISI